jgi:AcrR family transcriptional regulator
MQDSRRADAKRSRARILDVARACDPAQLRLNEVAKRAGLGVGTVYRHFPSVHALIEAVVSDDLVAYRELARAAAAEPDPSVALELLVRRGLALQLVDGGLQAVLLAAEDGNAEVAALKSDLRRLTESLLTAARDAGGVRADLTVERLLHLVCGVEHAVRMSGTEDPAFYIDTLLAGLRRPAP